MQESMPKSVKGKSRSAYNEIANPTIELPRDHDGTITSLDNGRKPTQLNRSTTVCPMHNDQCKVQFIVFCNPTTKKWFLSAPKKSTDSFIRCHHNHTKLLPSHICTPSKDIPQDVIRFITDSLKTGTPIRTIIDVAKNYLNITLSEEQIKKRQSDYIDDMIEELEGEDRSDIAKMNAAQKLIRLFDSMDDVSYVYVKHHHQSGFVTYTKDKGCTIQQTSFTTEETTTLASEIEIESWRTSLGLDNNENILVSFAWGFNCELRKLRMFPEYLAVDGTFGLNKQKRTLLTATGYDGEKKTFIGFCCFMPSKQKKAYRCAIGKAMPYLVGNAMKYNQVIVCDMEQAMVDAIKDSINDPASMLRYSKLRFDYYHLFEQK